MSLMTRTTPENTSIKLQCRDFHLVGAKAGMTVVCEKGMLWLTQSNDRQDYMLNPGDRLEVNQHTRVLIEAMSDAHVSIIYPN